MENIFKLKQMEKEDHLAAARFFQEYLQKRKARK
jgi:DNA primase